MVTWSKILRGALLRFLPGALSIVAIVIGMEASRGAQLSPLAPLLLGGQALALGAGYASVLAAFRSRLRGDARPEGRRSLIAGICSSSLLLAVWILVRGPWHWWATMLAAFLVGAGGAGLMFFPWLSATGSDRDVQIVAHASSNEEL